MSRETLLLLETIAWKHSVSATQVARRRGSVRAVAARFEFWNELRGRGWSLSKIGRLTGHAHSTVHQGTQRFKELSETA